MARGQPRDADTLYVLLELGDVLARRIPRRRSGGGRGGAAPSRDLFSAALTHLPKLEAALARSGLRLAEGEDKSTRMPQRLTITRTAWRNLGRAAQRHDLTRPQLLRALLRIELGLATKSTD